MGEYVYLLNILVNSYVLVRNLLTSVPMLPYLPSLLVSLSVKFFASLLTGSPPCLSFNELITVYLHNKLAYRYGKLV